jgi:hypothetical protein
VGRRFGRSDRRRADDGLSWGAECNLDSGGTEGASQNFTADHGKGRYYVAAGIRRRNGSIDLSRPRFRAGWFIDRTKVEPDGRTLKMNLVSLGTYATADEAKNACAEHRRGMVGSTTEAPTVADDFSDTLAARMRQGESTGAPDEALDDIPTFLDRTRAVAS